jgi:acyl dehydratase
MSGARKQLPLADYRACVGHEIGVSAWIRVDQQRIDMFARCTDDDQFIHVDPVRAAETPLGGTIAHGFLTLSLLSAMAYDAVPEIEGTQVSLNYGINGVRFLSPVRSGKNVRGRFTLQEVSERSPGQWRSTMAVSVEIEGESRPALVAEWISLVRL